MVSHLECAAATVWETAILISIRLCLSSLSTHKSLLQSEINSYWSALISQVRHEEDAATGTSHCSQCPKHHFVCEIAAFCGAPPPLTLTGRMMACEVSELHSAGQQTHTYATHTPTKTKPKEWCLIMMVSVKCPAAMTRVQKEDKRRYQNPGNKSINLSGGSRSCMGEQAESGRQEQVGSRQMSQKSKAPNTSIQKSLNQDQKHKLSSTRTPETIWHRWETGPGLNRQVNRWLTRHRWKS